MPIRSYRFRIYPTLAQRRRLAIEFGHARWVWNWTLEMQSHWYRDYGESVSFPELSRELTFLKRLEPYQAARKTPSFEGGDISAIARQGDQ